MSKSVGNVVKPLDLAGVFGADAFRYFLVRDMAIGRDADFSEELLRSRYESTLANGLGNLAHRLMHMIVEYCGGAIPDAGSVGGPETELRDRCTQLVTRVFHDIDSFSLDHALCAVEAVVRDLNRYVERNAPWARSKEGDHKAVRRVLYNATEALRLVSVLLHPVMPGKTRELWHSLGWTPSGDLSAGLEWGGLLPGSAVTLGRPLFPRID